MLVQGSTQLTRLFICVVLVLAISVLPSSGQEKTKVAGQMTLTQPGRQAIEIGDTPGHQLVLARENGINVSIGEHKFLDSAEAVNMAFDDLAQGNGPQQGYLRLNQKADTLFVKWQGEVSTALSAEKTSVTTFQGAWFYTKGTGQLQNIQGRGSYKGKFISQTEYTVDWEGEYSLKK